MRASGARSPPHFVLARLWRAMFPLFLLRAPAAQKNPPHVWRACGAQFPPHLFLFCAPAARCFRVICFCRACGAQFPPHFVLAHLRRGILRHRRCAICPPPFCHLRTAGAQFLCHFILARLKRAIFPPFFCAPAARSFPLILFFASAARDFPSGFLRIFARLQLAILPPCFFGGRLDLPGRPHGANRRYGLRRV